MTPRERAIDATWDTGGPDWTTVDRARLEARVEQAIIAAVEAEREQCAKIARDEARQWGKNRARQGAALAVEEKIRARSNASSHSA